MSENDRNGQESRQNAGGVPQGSRVGKPMPSSGAPLSLRAEHRDSPEEQRDLRADLHRDSLGYPRSDPLGDSLHAEPHVPECDVRRRSARIGAQRPRAR